MQKTDLRKIKSLWSKCLASLKDAFSEEEFKNWFSVIEPVAFEDDYLYLSVPTTYYYEFIDTHYSTELLLIIRKMFGQNTKIRYKVNIANKQAITSEAHDRAITQNRDQRAPIVLNQIGDRQLPNPLIVPGIQQVNIPSQLKEDYNFDTFVEGSCNKFARSAGYAVAQNPGKTSFNPLLIYSSVGLGKTHLVHAIGLETKKLHPEKVVLYISADQFLRQYTKSCENKTTNDFLQFYLLVDVLILDDIQILEGKKATQEVFFQIFNWLHQSGKQIIITADKAPSNMLGFEERVLSRLKWGLNAELTVPDVATRIDIIKRKMAGQSNVQIPEQVIEYLAYSVSSSVRELEGALISLQAHAILSKTDITMDLAREIVGKFVKANTREITVGYIQKVVCNYYNLTLEEFNSRSRKNNIVTARHVGMYLARKLTKASLTSIGTQCGGKDHATVLHACKTIETNCSVDKNFAKSISDIEGRILK